MTAQTEALQVPITKVVQVTNIAPQATKDQMQTLFGFLGKIEDIRLYPTIRDVSVPVQSRICYVKFFDAVCVGVAQHMTNTVFIDRALIVTPYASPEIPDEYRALDIAAQANVLPGLYGNNSKLPPHVTNQIEGTPPNQVITTHDPVLVSNGLPPYPPLPINYDSTRIEEIRRTLIVVNLDPSVTAQQLIDFFTPAGDVKYARFCKKDNDPNAYALVEFSEQSSVINALKMNGQILNGKPVQVGHSIINIEKPQAKSNEAAQREIEEAMTRVKEAENLISAAIDPVIGILSKEKKRGRSRSKSRRRTRSRSRGSRRRRSRSRSSRRRRRSRSRKRTRSRSRSRKKRSRDRRRSRTRTRSRSRGRSRKSRSRSRSKKGSDKSSTSSKQKDRKDDIRSLSKDKTKDRKSKEKSPKLDLKPVKTTTVDLEDKSDRSPVERSKSKSKSPDRKSRTRSLTRSITPRIKSRSPSRGKSRSLSRKKSRSPSRKKSRSLSIRKSRSLSRKKSRSPSRKTSRSLSRKKSRSLSRKKSRSLSRKKSRSPSIRKKSRSVSRRKSRTPRRRTPPSPRRRSRSRSRRKSRTPIRRRSRSSRRKRSRTPRRKRSRTPPKWRSRSPSSPPRSRRRRRTKSPFSP